MECDAKYENDVLDFDISSGTAVKAKQEINKSKNRYLNMRNIFKMKVLLNSYHNRWHRSYLRCFSTQLSNLDFLRRPRTPFDSSLKTRIALYNNLGWRL